MGSSAYRAPWTARVLYPVAMSLLLGGLATFLVVVVAVVAPLDPAAAPPGPTLAHRISADPAALGAQSWEFDLSLDFTDMPERYKGGSFQLALEGVEGLSPIYPGWFARLRRGDASVHLDVRDYLAQDASTSPGLAAELAAMPGAEFYGDTGIKLPPDLTSVVSSITVTMHPPGYAIPLVIPVQR